MMLRQGRNAGHPPSNDSWFHMEYIIILEYWVNSENNNTIPDSKWHWTGTKLSFNLSIASDPEGCQAVRLSFNRSANRVDTVIGKVRCDATSGVKSFVCEKTDPSTPGM